MTPPETLIYPVIVAVAGPEAGLTGREKVAALSALARRALAISAVLSGICLPARLEKNDHGAPIPFNGVHWSLTHKSAYVAGVVAPEPVGIDIETVRPFHPGLPRKIATENEWALARIPVETLLFRFWTAKEAVLKASGTGLRGLDRCRIVSVPEPTRTVVRFQDRDWTVFHRYFDGQVAAITGFDAPLCWSLLELPHRLL